MGEAVEIWRGGVNTWECDEMGHMNVRFYVAKAMEGLAGLALRLGMPRAFAPGSATLVVREHHVRFLREARPGAALHMTGGVVEWGESEAGVLQRLTHSRTGELCATFLTRVEHASADARPFAWPERVRLAAEALMVEVPPEAAPRGILAPPPAALPSLARADALGLVCIGRGTLSPADCDAFGRMRADQLIGRISDGVTNLLAGVREAVAASAPADMPRRVGGAVLENRLRYLDQPRIGDHLEIRSGLAGFDHRTQRMVHWMLDPVSGACWGTSEVVAINFDLDARKALPITPEAQAALSRYVVQGLA